MTDDEHVDTYYSNISELWIVIGNYLLGNSIGNPLFIYFRLVIDNKIGPPGMRYANPLHGLDQTLHEFRFN